jgi:hypothetical protein
MGLGLKIKNNVDMLGKKANGAINKFGKKSNMVINKLDKTADQVLDKSGGVTNAIRKTANIGNQIVHGINESGLREVPIVGSVASAIESGTKQLSRGATKLDQVRDDLKDRKDRLSNDARNRVGNIQGQAREFV